MTEEVVIESRFVEIETDAEAYAIVEAFAGDDHEPFVWIYRKPVLRQKFKRMFPLLCEQGKSSIFQVVFFNKVEVQRETVFADSIPNGAVLKISYVKGRLTRRLEGDLK